MRGEGEGRGRLPQLGSLDPAVEEERVRREGDKGKEGSLGWGVQALLFSTLSTAETTRDNLDLVLIVLSVS